jgi:hypothetical protein
MESLMNLVRWSALFAVGALVSCGTAADVGGVPPTSDQSFNTEAPTDVTLTAPIDPSGTVEPTSIAQSNDGVVATPLPSDDPEVAKQSEGTFVGVGFVVSANGVTRLCRAVLESAYPQCGFPNVILTEEVALQILEAKIDRTDIDKGTFVTKARVVVSIAGPIRYDQSLQSYVASSSALAGTDLPDAKINGVLVGAGTIGPDDVLTGQNLLDLGFKISPSGGVQVFGNGKGFLVWSLLPLSVDAETVLSNSLAGQIEIEAFLSRAG